MIRSNRVANSGLISCAVLLSLLVPGTGWAQQPPVTPQSPQSPNSRDQLTAAARAVLSADFQLGPFFLQPRLASAAGAQSVPNRRREDDPTKAELDFRVNITPGIGIALPIKGRHFLSFSPRAEFNWFLEFEGLRRLNIVLPASYAFSSPRFDFTLSGHYVKGQSTTDDPVLLDGEPAAPDFETDNYEVFTTSSVAATAGLWVTSRTRLGFRSRYRTAGYDDSEDPESGGTDNADRNRDTASLGATYSFALSPAVAISAVYDWRETKPQDPESFRAVTENRLGAQLDLTPSPSFRTSIFAGQLWQQHDDPERENFRGLTFLGTASTQPGGVVSIRLDAERRVNPSFWQNNSYYLRYGGGGSIEVAVSRVVALGARASYHRHEYPNVSTDTQLDGSTLTDKREDELMRWSGTFRWSITARNALHLDVGRQERRSNFDRNNLEGMILRVGVVAAY